MTRISKPLVLALLGINLALASLTARSASATDELPKGHCNVCYDYEGYIALCCEVGCGGSGCCSNATTCR